jgi:hypothetical protein
MMGCQCTEHPAEAPVDEPTQQQENPPHQDEQTVPLEEQKQFENLDEGPSDSDSGDPAGIPDEDNENGTEGAPSNM